MGRQRNNNSEAIGTDAFLDIVANLVGILLILIMVIGVRMDDVRQHVDAAPVVESSEPEESFPPVAVPDAEAARAELNRVERAVDEANREQAQLAELAAYQKRDRDNLMLAVTRAQQILKERRETLSQQQREDLDAALQQEVAQEQYDSLVEQIEAAQQALKDPPSEVLQHLATPLAKTVFVREEHFRLKSQRLQFVPLVNMTNRLKREARNKLWKLEGAAQITEVIGPEEGFEMRYTLRRRRVPFRTEGGLMASRQVVELDRFVMVPLDEFAGETLPQALQKSSSFRQKLANWSPRTTIITVWVYPDSFGAFRELKAALHELGFLTAARPIPEEQLISGSPHGTRSAAQ